MCLHEKARERHRIQERASRTSLEPSASPWCAIRRAQNAMASCFGGRRREQFLQQRAQGLDNCRDEGWCST